ncbi:MAG: phosphatidylserine decarboxylase, partial [Candidatus Hydrogenedentota bacterium]
MNPKFSSWKVGAPYYAPLFLLSVFAQWALCSTAYPYTAAPLWLAALFTLNFFRDPPRKITTDPDKIVSPADGLIDGIDD